MVPPVGLVARKGGGVDSWEAYVFLQSKSISERYETNYFKIYFSMFKYQKPFKVTFWQVKQKKSPQLKLVDFYISRFTNEL